MACLSGHATDGPGGWKEPRALAATDHTAPRAHQGRGRPTIRRRVSGECAGGRPGAGSVIPHARAIRALVVAMIEATFRTPAVSVTGGRDRAPAAGRATRARAVRVAPIAGHTDRKDAMTAPARFLAKGRIHGVGAAVRSDWTYSPNRGTTDRTASACRSPRQSRGPGGSDRALTLSLFSLRDHSSTDTTEAVDGGAPMDAQNAPTAAWKSRPEREIPTPPTAILDCVITRPDRNDPAREV